MILESLMAEVQEASLDHYEERPSRKEAGCGNEQCHNCGGTVNVLQPFTDEQKRMFVVYDKYKQIRQDPNASEEDRNRAWLLVDILHGVISFSGRELCGVWSTDSIIDYEGSHWVEVTDVPRKLFLGDLPFLTVVAQEGMTESFPDDEEEIFKKRRW